MTISVYKDHFRRNITLAVPVMLSQLGHVMVGVADSAMVGQLGTIPLAAASLGNSIFAIILTFGIGVSFAITPLIAAADGKKHYQKSGKIFKHGLYINLVAGILLYLVTFGIAYVLPFLNQPEEVVIMAGPYLNVIGLSLIPFMIFQSFKQFAEGLSLTKKAMYIVVGANLINIGLNYILIYGKLGLAPMGLYGAGLATLISRIIMAIAMGLYIFKARAFQPYIEKFRFKGFSRKLGWRMLRLGLPTGLQFVFEVGAFSAAAIMAGWLGAKQLAAHQIAISLASVSYMMASGISAAATVRVGNQLGLNDIPTLRIAGFTSFVMAVAFMTFTCLMFVLGKDLLPGFYVDEQDVIQVASSLLVIAAFFQIFDGVQVVALGALRGLEDVKMPTLVAVVAYWLIGLPLGYAFGFELGLGVKGIWYGLLTGLALTAIMLFFRFNTLTKRLLARNNPKFG